MLWLFSLKRTFCYLLLIFIICFYFIILIINDRLKLITEKEIIAVPHDHNDYDEYYDLLFKQKLMTNSKYKKKFGEMGKPVVLPKNLSREITSEMLSDDEKLFGYRRHISDLISLQRLLPDNRDKDCKEAYAYNGTKSLMKDDFLDDSMPMTSVIIIFHNEAWTTLLRTVHSVLLHSTRSLVLEILLIDDSSTMEELKRPLQLYLKKEQFKIVRLLRTHVRLGISEARKFAARHVTAPVLTFLDPCSECTERWLEPLLQRISLSEDLVAVPVIDRIDPINFEYQWRGSDDTCTGGFDWNLRRTSERVSIKNSIYPISNPVILNGIFAIHISLFEMLDINDDYFSPHDPDLIDLETSFKIWLCGGKIELMPCSHVGCVSRIKSSTPSSFYTEHESIKTQKARIAEIWMDQYKQYFYQRMGNGIVKIGYVQEIKLLKTEIECKPFEWYLNYVYPSIENIEYYLTGELLYLKENNHSLCVDSQNDSPGLFKSIKLSQCHGKGENQFWILSTEGKITQDGACLSYENDLVTLTKCNNYGEEQFWWYKNETKQILHKNSNMCLTVSHREKIYLNNCTYHKRQSWEFKRYNNKVIF